MPDHPRYFLDTYARLYDFASYAANIVWTVGSTTVSAVFIADGISEACFNEPDGYHVIASGLGIASLDFVGRKAYAGITSLGIKALSYLDRFDIE